MRSDVILIANEGQTIPTPLAKKVVDDYDSCLGVAYIENGKMVCEAQAAGTLLEDFEGHQKDFAESTRMYQFADSQTQVKEDDLQPFVLVREGEAPVIVCMVAGQFDIENDGQMSDGYVLVETVLREKVDDLYKLCDKDLAKVIERMSAGSFAKEIDLFCKPFKATIVFMFDTGKTLVCSRSDDHQETPWGFASSMLGLKEGGFPPKEEEKKVSALGKRFGGIKAPDPKVEETTKPAPHKPVLPPQDPMPTVVGVPTVTKVGATTIISKGPTVAEVQGAPSVPEMVWVQPFTHMKVHKLEDWYRKRNKGVVPENWRERPPIQMLAEIAKKQGSVQILQDEPKIAGYKSFKEAEAALKEVATPVTAIPVHPTEKIAEIGKLIQNNKQIEDPTESEKLENNWPTFAKLHSLTMEDMFRMPLKLLVDIAKTDPQQAAHGWHGTLHQLRLLMQQKIPAKEEVVAVPAEQPKKKFGGIKR